MARESRAGLVARLQRCWRDFHVQLVPDSAEAVQSLIWQLKEQPLCDRNDINPCFTLLAAHVPSS